jgi:Domain of unknown function (DUF1840)
MLYKFKSKAAGDLIMLGPNGQRVLQIVGKGFGGQPDASGIITPEQMPAAIAALEAAIAQEEAEQQQAIDAAKQRGEVPPSFDAISLRKRAWPFVEMLRRCQAHDAPVTWGV